MTNNDVLRKLRYTFDFSDQEMIDLFADGDLTVNRSQVSDWMKKDDNPEFKEMMDQELAHFLNGFIAEKRGKREGPSPVPEKVLNNNIILRKIKIALKLDDEDMIEILGMVDVRVSKHEISAFFRKPTQRQYRPCLDQFFRNFMLGLQFKYRK